MRGTQSTRSCSNRNVSWPQCRFETPISALWCCEWYFIDLVSNNEPHMSLVVLTIPSHNRGQEQSHHRALASLRTPTHRTHHGRRRIAGPAEVSHNRINASDVPIHRRVCRSALPSPSYVSALWKIDLSGPRAGRTLCVRSVFLTKYFSTHRQCVLAERTEWYNRFYEARNTRISHRFQTVPQRLEQDYLVF